MRRKYLLLMLFAGATCFTACSDDSKNPSGQGPIVEQDADPTTPDAGTNPDASTPGNQDEDAKDPGVDPPDAIDQPDTEGPEECVPTLTECPVDQCGEVDNGCGEMIQCEPCPCNEGIATVEECGVCGFGTRSCGTDETGFGVCDGPEIFGLSDASDRDTCDRKLIYADASVTSSGDGSKEAPFATYADAVAASSAGQTIVLVGSEPFTEPLLIKNGVSVLGGISSGRWDAHEKAIFEVAAPTSGPVFGLKAENIDRETRLMNLSITTEDAPESETNYGGYVSESNSLYMKAVEISAGNGGQGKSGADGESGQNGSPGENAQDVGEEYPDPETVHYQIPKGGLNSECPSANGGNGGQGWHSLGIGGTRPATSGESTGGARGGSGGWGEYQRQAGGDGEPGDPVTRSGDHGDGGIQGGQILNGLWVPRDVAMNGTRGAHGHGGGGGGGAHGITGSFAAPPGGGGGAGGCGGQPGEGGKPGGGSFGLLLIRSDIVAEDSLFTAGLGGQGGRGGLGGSAGYGARGGTETPPLEVEFP